MINCLVTLASDILIENFCLVVDRLSFRQNRTRVDRSIGLMLIDLVDLYGSLTSTNHEILTLNGLSCFEIDQSLSEVILERKFVHSF